MRFALFLCVLAVTVLGASATSTFWACNFTPNSTVLVLSASINCNNQTGASCVGPDVTTGTIAPWSCTSGSTSGYGSKYDPRFFAPGVATNGSNYLADWNSATRGQTGGYALQDTSADIYADTFVLYWNDDSTSNPHIDIDVIGYSFSSYRQQRAAGNTQIAFANYVNNERTATANGYPYLYAHVGAVNTSTSGGTNTNTVWFAGDGITSSSVQVAPTSGMIPVAIFQVSQCVGYEIPLWSGYVNGSIVGNDTVLFLFGDLTTGNITVWSPVAGAVTRVLPGNNTGSVYTACNFVNTVSSTGTVTGWPENNVNITIEKYGSGGCGNLKNNINVGVIPYGTCQTFTNGPYYNTYAYKQYTVNNTVVVDTAAANYRGSGSTTFRGDGLDFLIAFYADDAFSTNGYVLDSPRNTYSGSTSVCYPPCTSILGSCTQCGGNSNQDMTVTLSPASNQQTYIIGMYATNWASLNSVSGFSSTMTVAFNQTYWATCSPATYSYYSCVATVPVPAVSYNVTLYTSSCYSYQTNCAKYYATSVAGVNNGNGVVSLLAFYGDFKINNIKTAQYAKGGAAASSGTGGITPSGGAAAHLVPQFAAIVLAIVAVLAALF